LEHRRLISIGTILSHSGAAPLCYAASQAADLTIGIKSISLLDWAVEDFKWIPLFEIVNEFLFAFENG
jgi:hypothetical protein